MSGFAALRVYLASPGNQLHAHAAAGMPVLVSYALFKDWMAQWLPVYGRVLVDSGAFSELTGTQKVDPAEYCDWARAQIGIDAFAGLDDIGGDWRRSLDNYRHGGFPTIHDTDPPELLDELLPIARAAGKWIGIGLKPPRRGKEAFVRWALERIPDDFHVHGWALRQYAHLRRLDSVDSTNWWRDAMDLRTRMPWLSYGETLEIVVKRYQRVARFPQEQLERSKSANHRRRPWPQTPIDLDPEDSEDAA